MCKYTLGSGSMLCIGLGMLSENQSMTSAGIILMWMALAILNKELRE